MILSGVVASSGESVAPLTINYLVIAGGGGGGAGTDADSASAGGGGGAGGYRSSNTISGTNSAPLAALIGAIGSSYNVTVGAGGAGNGIIGREIRSGSGTASVFHTNVSTGGGGAATGDYRGLNGGSGGGGGTDNLGGTGLLNQGNNGGSTPNNQGGGSGGGASSAGLTGSRPGGVLHQRVPGGAGIVNSFFGTSVEYSKGGDGGAYSPLSGAQNGPAGTANTGMGGAGGGGGEGATFFGTGGNGGSGVVILRYPAVYNISLSAGLTGSTVTTGTDKITRVTAGTGTLSWAVA